MLEWLLLGWIWLIGVITGCLIRQWVYIGRAESIRRKCKGR